MKKEEIESLDRAVLSTEMKTIKKILPENQSPEWMDVAVIFCKTSLNETQSAQMFPKFK